MFKKLKKFKRDLLFRKSKHKKKEDTQKKVEEQPQPVLVQPESNYISTCKTCGKAYKSESEGVAECPECILKRKNMTIWAKIMANKILVIGLVIFVALIAAFIILSIQRNTTILTENVVNNVTLTKKEVAIVSIANYLPDKSNYPINFSEIVYLSQESVRTSNVTSRMYRYVTDDYDNKIKVIMGLNAAILYDPLFPQSGKTGVTYLVTGTIRMVNSEPLLDILMVVKKDRSLVDVTYTEAQTVQVNHSINSGTSINFTKGLDTLLFR